MRALVFCLVAAAGLVACGPIQATTGIVRASEELRTAKLAGADVDAPYEYTKAELLLRMAKEREGFSDFEAAKTFADEAQRLAIAAKENAPRNARMKQIRLSAPPRPPVAPDKAPSGKGGVP